MLERRDLIKEKFRQADEAGDGFISQSQLMKLLQHLAGSSGVTFSEKDFQLLFSAADKNGSGQIQYEQFIDWVYAAYSGKETAPVAKIPPIAIVLQLEVKEDCVEEFIRIMTDDALGSRSEDGCLRFDLLRDTENPCKFTTYEVFKDAAAMDAHRDMPYVKAWGAFQYGDKKPIVKKTLLKADGIDFQDGMSGVSMATPIGLVLEVEIKKEYVEEFLQVMTADASGSRAEPGCLRFDLLRDKENPCKFISYEVFESQEAMDAHREMPHVKAWGAFQYGDKKPVVNKALSKNNAINFQGSKVDAWQDKALQTLAKGLEDGKLLELVSSLDSAGNVASASGGEGVAALQDVALQTLLKGLESGKLMEVTPS